MTVEAALALTAVIATVVLCLGALLAASTQVRCVDAAREAARLAARGDSANALPTAKRIAPASSEITLRTEGARAIAVVSARTPLLPLLTLRAEAVATLEPGVPK
ncbi:TadE family type IV pilus minor pilin [Nocardia barduliensis]|uniref:TadE family type IV pilus minor pilin n=1 Tax=Nocardia barduliensis TaxID=2736643 RepID=UPI0028B0A7B9|nr:TadE family type IV pilus minor pilin [Nocardia barduliensis]